MDNRNIVDESIDALVKVVEKHFHFTHEGLQLIRLSLKTKVMSDLLALIDQYPTKISTQHLSSLPEKEQLAELMKLTASNQELQDGLDKYYQVNLPGELAETIQDLIEKKPQDQQQVILTEIKEKLTQLQA
jgi:hypothetical protein